MTSETITITVTDSDGNKLDSLTIDVSADVDFQLSGGGASA